MDVIKITDLEVFAHHGVFPEENALGQKFLVCADLQVGTRKAGQTDDLADAVNYGEVCQLITRVMQERTFKLIERVAEVLAQSILEEFPLVQGVRMEVKKPWAPIGLPVGCVSVCIERTRG